MNTLNFQIALQRKEIKFINNNTENLQDKDNLNFIIEGASYGLSSRKKGE